MFFTRTSTFNSPVAKTDLQKRLLGAHVRIHNLDFEILEQDNALLILPHEVQVESIKTLPITEVDIKDEGGQAKVTLTSKMRPADSGGPNLILIFCFFLFVAAFVLHYVDNGSWMITYILMGVDLVIVSALMLRLNAGYFDYVRKVQEYVKSKGAAVSNIEMKASIAV